jgi:ankyrin repeat protein
LLETLSAVCRADIYEVAEQGHVNRVRECPDEGVDPNAHEEEFAPLHLAAIKGHIAVAKLLLARGCLAQSACVSR